MFHSGWIDRPDGGGRLRLLFGAATVCALLAVALLPGRAQARQYSSCQPYAKRACMFPFPDNRLTVANKHTATGLRVKLPAKAMPVGTIPGGHIHVSTRPFDAADGFSPGSAILLHIKGLSTPAAFKRTHPVGLLNMAAYLKRNAPIVVLDEQTGKRVMVYSQLDSTATTAAARNLMILPGGEWREGHTYVVVLRNLRTASGHLIAAPSWFRALRNGGPLPKRERSQAARYRRIFKVLHRAGIARNSKLYAAWDFTVASRQNLTASLLHIRNVAFRSLGDKNLADSRVQGRAPSYTITSDAAQSGVAVRDVVGTFQVPCFLNQCGPAATAGFHYSSKKFGALPTRNGTATAQFECVVPDSATPSDPTRISLYGHGLLGGMGEVTSSAITSLAIGQHITLCATNWWGLASPDSVFDAKVVATLNLFPRFIARLQQGVLNTLFLGRLMRNRQGFAANPAFQSSGKPVIRRGHLFYDGNSQGGIFGGLTTAVSPDIRRAVLGVTGVDYANVLVQRSVDFGSFGQLLDTIYAGPTDQSAYTATLDLLDQQWDRADPVSFVQGLTNHPLPNTPRHQVLMQIAYGDHQVSMYAGAAEAREIGARAYLPNGTGLASDRKVNRNLFYGLKPVPLNGKYRGSVIEIWDDGPSLVANPPVANIPPSTGHDPHGDPRATPLAQTQIGDFIKHGGSFVNVCKGKPCVSGTVT